MADRRKHASDEEIVAALASGRTTTEAAAAVGVSTQTIYRRMTDPAFRARVGEARAEQWRPDAERLRSEVSRSLDTLIAIRDDESKHDSTRVRCAIAIIELATKLHELVDTSTRLAALEAQVAGEPKEADA